MATGDKSDMQARLLGLLPPWFGDSNPVLAGVLAGAAAALTWVYGLYAYAKAQTRISTATDGFLDLIAADFFGTTLQRNINEGDTAYRARIKANLFKPTATRAAISAAVQSVTGLAPKIIEPFSPADCGAYGMANSGYGVAGAYGSNLAPAQAFVIAYRPATAGVAYVGGYRTGPWGYGAGKGCYTTQATGTTDAAIHAAIAQTKAEGVTIWTTIQQHA